MGPGYDFPDFFSVHLLPSQTMPTCATAVGSSPSTGTDAVRDITYSIGGQVADATAKVTKYENPTFTNPIGNW